MNNIDKISADSRILIDSAKDTVSTNFLSLISRKDINLDPSQIEKILNVVNVSIEEGYQKALPYYQNTIKKHF
jgi:hypothetical protein